MTPRPWLELMRLSNAPTIVSNALVGWAIGLASAGELRSWSGIVPTTIALLLLYIGGMALNDVMDADLDRSERPSRPIPSGRISRAAASVFVVGCFLASLAALATRGWLALGYGFVLMVVIILYNALHTRSAATVILMGLCRGLVYVTAALAVTDEPDWPTLLLLSAALVSYVLLFSLIARGEVSAKQTRFEDVIVLGPMFAVVFGECVQASAAPWLTILGRGLFLLWMLGIAVYIRSPQRNVGRAVAGWIAGIALLDLYHLTRLDQPGAALIAGLCFVLTLAGQKWIAGT